MQVFMQQLLDVLKTDSLHDYPETINYTTIINTIYLRIWSNECIDS